MKKLLGVFLFLLVLEILILIATDRASWASNHHNLGKRIGLEGIVCLGVGLLIISGGIDLSIGSTACLCACVFCKLVLDYDIPLAIAAVIMLMVGACIGLLNGLLVTYFRVQAFVVTLCGLFLYRGAARWVANEQSLPIGASVADLTQFFRGSFLYLPNYLWLLLGLLAASSVFLHLTIYGRYFYAIGSNERAARYSGINVNLYKILAYVLSSTFAAIYALMGDIIHTNSVVPSTTGSNYELYAIAGAVLGGCSLRGGEGTTAGILIGTAIMCLLPNLTNMWGISSRLEPTVIGAALLICAIMDEFLRRRQMNR